MINLTSYFNCYAFFSYAATVFKKNSEQRFRKGLFGSVRFICCTHMHMLAIGLVL